MPVRQAMKSNSQTSEFMNHEDVMNQQSTVLYTFNWRKVGLAWILWFYYWAYMFFKCKPVHASHSHLLPVDFIILILFVSQYTTFH